MRRVTAGPVLGALLLVAACGGSSGEKPLGTADGGASTPPSAAASSEQPSAPAVETPLPVGTPVALPSPPAPRRSASPSPTASPPRSASPTASPSASPSATPSPAASGSDAGDAGQPVAGERAVTVTITKGRVSPPPSHVDVAVGTPVAITVSEDRDDVVHVHGYDEEVALHAGTPVVIRFVADQTGTFEVETHETGLTLFQLVVR